MHQPEYNKSANQLTTATEDEHYLKLQVARFKTGDLNRKAFCRRSDLNYHRFQYWYHKFERMENPKPSVGVVPIKLKVDPKRNLNLPALCSVQLDTGAREV